MFNIRVMYRDRNNFMNYEFYESRQTSDELQLLDTRKQLRALPGQIYSNKINISRIYFYFNCTVFGGYHLSALPKCMHRFTWKR